MVAGPSDYAPIADYALIGDCRSAALVSRDGAIDWLCMPRFDSASVFAGLLDIERGGRFVVRPVGPYTVTRRYIPDTAVLETTFRADGGVVRVIDLMPVDGGEESEALRADHEVLRVVECLEGAVDVEVSCDPRPAYGRVVPRLTHRGNLGFYYEHGASLLALRTNFPLVLSADQSGARGRCVMKAGERHHVALTFAHREPAVIAAIGSAADARVDRTIEWWQRWVARCRYEGPHRAAVVRSAITLKLMTYAPSGAVVAAPTTSLPEEIGGVRNWDYRYCWVRDASLTLQALYDLGYPDEAEAFLSWLLHTTRMTRLELQIVYDLYGEKDLPEKELDHLAGYAGSRPVRVGNGAATQLQLDTYGEVMDAVYEFVSRGGRLDGQTARLVIGLGRTVCRRWREPDEGIWEVRGGRRHHTYSKAMCWVALDRLVRLHEEGHLRAPVEDFRRERDAVREQVESRGFDEKLGSYTAVFDGGDVDASLLLLARYGYAEPGSERMRGTFDRICRRLENNGVLYRYRDEDDGLTGKEGAFGICSFWAAETQARLGDQDAAAARFERLLGYANDLGLFAEEIDPETGTALGNFPQAFTHVGLIDAALTLHERSPAPGGERGVRSTEATI